MAKYPATFGTEFLEEIRRAEHGCGCSDKLATPINADASVSGSDALDTIRMPSYQV